MKTSMRQYIAATTAAAIATAGTLAMTAPVDAAAPSDNVAAKIAAKKKATKVKYAMGGDAYGTQIKGGELGVNSGRTAHSFVHCNTTTKTRNTALVGGAVLPDNELLDLGVVKTSVKARKGAKAARKEGFPKGTKAATVSVSSVADIKLLNIAGLGLNIKALETEARAWVDKKGKFHTKERYTGAKIEAHTGIQAIDDLLDGLPIGDLVDLLLDGILKDVVVNQVVNGVLTITGLGEIKLDKQKSKITKNEGRSVAKALEVRLYGTNGKGNDDIVVTLGGTRARVLKGAESGLFGGGAYGLNANVLNGVLTTAKLADQPMPCAGTGGKWMSTGVANVDLLQAGLIKVDGVKSQVRTTGKSKKKKRTATAQARTARVEIGGSNGLVVEAITSTVKVVRNKAGKLTRKTTVDLGDIFLGGQQIDLDQLLNPVVDTVDQLLEAIGIASVKTGVVRKTKNGAGLIAIQVQLLNGNVADIKIGDVEARIRK